MQMKHHMLPWKWERAFFIPFDFPLFTLPTVPKNQNEGWEVMARRRSRDFWEIASFPFFQWQSLLLFSLFCKWKEPFHSWKSNPKTPHIGLMVLLVDQLFWIIVGQRTVVTVMDVNIVLVLGFILSV